MTAARPGVRPTYLTDPDDPAVVEALTRKCSMGGCHAAIGIPCVCTTCLMPHVLSECSATKRVVHHARTQPVPKGGD